MTSMRDHIVSPQHVVLCGGRVVTGPDWRQLGLTLLLLTTPCVLFAVFEMPYLYARVSPAVPFVFATVWAFAYAVLMATSLRDPGVVPRAPDYVPTPAAEVDYEERMKQATYPFGGPLPPMVFYDFGVRGTAIKTKFCTTCRIIRHPRVIHCGVCNSCIDRFDHHCPWVANCVGRRNHRFFTAFVTAVTVLAVLVEVFVWVHLAELMRESSADSGPQRFRDALQQSPISFVLAVYAFLFGLSVSGLAIGHWMFAAQNTTTNENLKEMWSRERGRAASPFTDGLLTNLARFWCGPMPPRFADWAHGGPAQTLVV